MLSALFAIRVLNRQLLTTQQEHKMSYFTRQTVPGFLKSPEAAKFLGLTESQFRTRHESIPSIQLHERGPRLFRIEDLTDFKDKAA